MDMRLLGFESGAASTILAVGTVIVLLLSLVVAAARRRNDYAEGAVAVIATAFGGVALASFLAVRYFANALADMAIVGGGIGALSLGMGEAAQLPLSATWIAAAATVVAMPFAFLAMRQNRGASSGARPGRLLGTAGVALAGAVVSVLLLRGALAFVLAAATPGAQPQGVGLLGEAVSVRLTVAGAGSAICFAVVMAQLFLLFRSARRATPSRAMLRVLVVALVLSLGVSTALVVGLRSYSSRSLAVALKGAPANSLPGWRG